MSHGETQSERVSNMVRKGAIEALLTASAGQEVNLPSGRRVLIRSSGLAGGGIALSATDVSEMRAAQNLLFQRLAAIEAGPDGIAIENSVGRLTYLNSAGVAHLAFASADRPLGASWREKYEEPPVTPKTAAFDITLALKASGDPKDQVRTHEIIGSPLEDGGRVIVIRDVTDNLETEAREEDLTRELFRLQRQDPIARLTAGVAHDFNNLLSAINGSAMLVGMVDALPRRSCRISSAGAQAGKLVTRLLDVGAGAEADGVFELACLLGDLPSLVETNLSGDVAFMPPKASQPVALCGNSGLLTQILINLILNARGSASAPRRFRSAPSVGGSTSKPLPALEQRCRSTGLWRGSTWLLPKRRPRKRMTSRT